jgi:hypothetical protein
MTVAIQHPGTMGTASLRKFATVLSQAILQSWVMIDTYAGPTGSNEYFGYNRVNERILRLQRTRFRE